LNFTALDSRLMTICLTMRRSAMSWIDGSISDSRTRFFSAARAATIRMVSDRIGSSSIISGSRLARPASIFDMSRMSLMTSSK